MIDDSNLGADRFILWLFQVATSKAVVDDKPPRTYMHLHLKLKKLQV